DITENTVESGADDLLTASEQHENGEAQEEELEVETLPEHETISSKSEHYQKWIDTQSSNTGDGSEDYEIIQVSGSLTVSSWEKLGRNLDFAAEQGTLKSRVPPIWKLVRSCLDQRCHEAVENGQAELEILQEERSEKAASERENKDRKRKQGLYPDLTEFRDSDEVKHVHFLTESVTENQKQTSEEEQSQHSGRRTKWPFGTVYCASQLSAALTEPPR
ncbi:hypothetical protein STEG23_008736, partial [Scotinomys teguina]